MGGGKLMSAVRRRMLSKKSGVSPNTPIVFEDAEVKRILVENWGGVDGGTAANNTRVGNVKVTGIAGELTYGQAASIVNLGTVFKGNTTIQHFTEMEYLTSMTLLPYQGFEGCSNLEDVELVNITGLNGSGYNNCFKNCTSLYELGDTTHITKLNGASIFQNTAITKIDMPLLEATTSDGYFFDVFNGCSYLVDVNLPLIKNIGNGSFRGCNSIEHLELPELNYINSGGNGNALAATIKTIKLPKLIKASQNFSGTQTGIIIGDEIQEVANGAFGGGYALQIRYVVIKATTPPTCGTNILQYNINPKIYVPDASVNAYKATTGFDTYVNNIYPISQFSTDFPDDVPYL